MSAIVQAALPATALLMRYAASGAYTDCYCMDVPRVFVLSDYLAAFYTSPVFKVERALLGIFAGKPANDEDALQLALGGTAMFSIWTVEARESDQILLREMSGRTRSWLMLAPVADSPGTTRLYFGSAVVPASRSATGETSFGFLFHALSGFHRLYTRALMRGAYEKLQSEPVQART